MVLLSTGTYHQSSKIHPSCIGGDPISIHKKQPLCFFPISFIMAEIIESISTLRGIDAEIFFENLNKDPTQKEIDNVRSWALRE